MKSTIVAAIFTGTLMAASLTGCVSNKKYSELKDLRQQMSQDYTTIQSNPSKEQVPSASVEATGSDIASPTTENQ